MSMIKCVTRLRVRYQETDRMGVVYHSNYLVWFEIGRTDLFKKIGLSYADLEREGYYLVVTEVHCKYKSPATYDDELEVFTALTEMKNSSLVFRYEVKKGEVSICTGTTKHAFLDRNRKIVKIPASLAERAGKG